MKVSEYINKLQALLNEHGDIEVQKLNVCFDRVEATSPTIAYVKILKGRQSKPAFYDNYANDEFLKGNAVIRI